MDLLQNPFHILNATPRDNRRKIVELAEERSLVMDSRECTQARSDLINPRKRLSAEVAWLPGLSPKRTKRLLKSLNNSTEELSATTGLPAMARANLLAACLLRLKASSSPKHVAKSIYKLVLTFEDINPEELRAIINEDRVVSGFPMVTDISVVEAEIHERRLQYRSVMKSALNTLEPRKLVKVVTFITELTTNKGEKHPPTLIADLVDLYEVEAQPFFKKEGENIETLVEKIRQAADGKKSDAILERLVAQLIQVVKNWAMIAQPIQVSKKSRGLDHDASNHIALIVRDLAIDLFNEHGKLDLSQRLTSMLQEVFAGVQVVAEIISEDSKTLNEIARQQARLIKDAKKQAKKWRSEITYEANMGVFSKSKLRISPEGIEWKNRRWELNSITSVRWGGILRSGTRPTYTIIFATNSDSVTIEVKRKDVYDNFVERLWKAVGVRILTDLLEGLKSGKRYRFGSAMVSDFGMELERGGWIPSDKHVFCRWDELVIWNGPGVFCVGKKDDKKLAAAFSYLEEDNIHVLEAAIRMFWKRGGDRLSSLLGD